MRIDLHTHSRASDGTDPPGEVVRRAHAARLDVVALTDHDTAAGWPEAAAVAREVGITLVPGIEISTRHPPTPDGRSVHLLAYLADPTHPPLVAALAAILEGREDRVPRICARLRAHGLDVTPDDVRRAAGPDAVPGRPHVADALVAAGACRDRDEAFDVWLGEGRPAHVHRYAASLEEMVPLVTAAGGVSVLAHPWGRHGPTGLDEGALTHLRELGLAGVEVDHQDHDAAARRELRAIAGRVGLLATGSSDYHGSGKSDHALGCNLTAPEEYGRLLELAGAAAQASGRSVPEVISGPATGAAGGAASAPRG